MSKQNKRTVWLDGVIYAENCLENSLEAFTEAVEEAANPYYDMTDFDAGILDYSRHIRTCKVV